MKVTFLGTNGWYDTTTGNTTCILVETQRQYIILDAGNGIYKFNDYARVEKPAYLFLSHFHLDHIEGLHILNKFKFTCGLNIIGQAGTKEILNTLVSYPFTVGLSELPYPVEIQEIREGRLGLPFDAECLFLRHSSPTMGFRFRLSDKVISYCPDTGYCENALKLAHGADLLIAECALKSGEDIPEWPHLNPETAARLAKNAGAKRLVLVHFDADRYKTFSDRNRAKRAAQKIFPEVIAAKDGMELIF